jgi:hypothetical protein
MSRKPQNRFTTDRPESGGADHRNERENSGLLGREKEKFAVEEAEKKQQRGEGKPVVDPAARKRRR